MEFFLSYNTEDKEVAGKIGKLLQKAGQTPFLAHDDIKPTQAWEKKILDHLDSCTALLAVITTSFGESAYANQEVGIVMGRGKLVIPLRVGSSELPGFVKSSQAISSSEANLDDAIGKVVRTAEDNLATSFVRPKQFTSLAELIDSRLEERREPYWRVTVRPQGFYSFIPKSSESDAWFSQSGNRPELLSYMESKPTSKGWTFGPKTTRFSEVAETGEFCYGRSISGSEKINIQSGIKILSQSIAFETKILRQFKFNPVQQTYILAELKLGLAHGQKLRIDTLPDALNETHSTDEQEVVEGRSLPLEDWEKNSISPVESIISLFCRSFGISLSPSAAKGLVASALS